MDILSDNNLIIFILIVLVFICRKQDRLENKITNIVSNDDVINADLPESFTSSTGRKVNI